jgi:hypothetical protein
MPGRDPTPAIRAAALLILAGAASPALAQFRVATWNVSFYNGTNREQAFKTAIYESFQGRSMRPDILIGQEFNSEAAMNTFRNLLNTAPDSPGDWAAAPFVNGPDTDSVFFYRTSKVSLMGVIIAVPGGDPNGAPRNVMRYDIRPAGYSSEGTVIACYSVHMKAGSGSGDQQRRLAEATAIRADTNSLPEGWNFLIAGDFNIQGSNQAAYQMLVGSQLNNRGRFYDPINSPGAWNQNINFRFIHTQAPGDTAGSAGMDDRFDIILLSDSISNGVDFTYIGNRTLPYSTTTWNDPNHSHRVWGNDGTTFQLPINTGNAMVGPVIAQALLDAAATDHPGGHLPVFLDLRVPAKVGVPEVVDVGTLTLGIPASATLPVANSADVPLWSPAGIATLSYSMTGSAGIGVPAGGYFAAPGVINDHTITIDTASAGPVSGTVTISSSSSEHPVRHVSIVGLVAPAGCYANCDGSTTPPILNVADFTCFLTRFAAGDTYPNCDGSTTTPVLNVADFTCFLTKFAAGCP